MMSDRHEGRHEVVGGGGGGGGCPIVVTHEPCVDQPRIHRIMSCIDAIFQILQSQVFGQDITRRTSRFFVRHCPLVATLTST